MTCQKCGYTYPKRIGRFCGTCLPVKGQSKWVPVRMMKQAAKRGGKDGAG